MPARTARVAWLRPPPVAPARGASAGTGATEETDASAGTTVSEILFTATPLVNTGLTGTPRSTDPAGSQVVASIPRVEARGHADGSSVDTRRHRRSWHLSRLVEPGGCPGV